MRRNTYTILSTDFISPEDGETPHYRMGLASDAFYKDGIQVIIDGQEVALWTNQGQDLWIHMHEGIIDAFVFRDKKTGAPEWEIIPCKGKERGYEPS